MGIDTHSLLKDFFLKFYPYFITEAFNLHPTLVFTIYVLFLEVYCLVAY